jgi:NADH dehydrogenase/NADH:ubiquinone oxidoreductase subunit G
VPKVTIDARTVEVEAGTNLIDAAFKAGVHIPHYCYHPRLSVVGQCRMCLVKIDGMPKLQAGCATQVMKDGMVVHTELPEVREAQQGMMEFLLINHPLDCPICDQAGECGLQDYAFKHGVAYSRFQFEDKRTYPGRERIPLGANVLLNMNRCIQCTRCIRFTQEIAGTGDLGFFHRGARTEIGTFPGKHLDNQLATCVVDICPVGALTSTRFRFAERVFYLDKKPSLCTGCEVGCNITIEHRRGVIKRYKPRFNPDVNDYWMCDYGRATFERYSGAPRVPGAPGTPEVPGVPGTPEVPGVPGTPEVIIARLTAPRLRRDAGSLGVATEPMRPRPNLGPELPAKAGRQTQSPAAAAAAATATPGGAASRQAAAPAPAPVSWKEALDTVARHLRSRSAEGAIAMLGSGFLTTEEAYLFAQLAEVAGTPHRSVAVDLGPERHIPNLQGGVTGREAAPNRRGAELAGLVPQAIQAATAATAAAAGSTTPPMGTPVSTAGGAGGAGAAASGGAAAEGGGNGRGRAAGAARAAVGTAAVVAAVDAFDADGLLHGDAAARCAVLVVCDSDFGEGAYDPVIVERLRRAQVLIVFGWADSPLAQAADVALPVATHAEKDGTFVNVEWRVQRFERAFPPPGQARPTVEALSELLARYDARWANLAAPAVFDRLAAELPAFAGLAWHQIPATGAPLDLPAARAVPASHVQAPEDTAVGI